MISRALYHYFISGMGLHSLAIILNALRNVRDYQFPTNELFFPHLKGFNRKTMQASRLKSCWCQLKSQVLIPSHHLLELCRITGRSSRLFVPQSTIGLGECSEEVSLHPRPAVHQRAPGECYLDTAFTRLREPLI